MHSRGPVAPSILPQAERADVPLTVKRVSTGREMTGWRVGWLTHPPSLSARFGALVQDLTPGTAGVLQPGGAGRCPGARAWRPRRAPAPRPGSQRLMGSHGIIGDHPAEELPARREGGRHELFRRRGVRDARASCSRPTIRSAPPLGVSCGRAPFGRRPGRSRRWRGWPTRCAARRGRTCTAGQAGRILIDDSNIHDIAAAHHLPETIRDDHRRLRARNGVVVFSDHVNAYHEAMEHVISHPHGGLDAEGVQALRDDAGVLLHLARRMGEARPAAADPAAFEALFAPVLASADALLAAVRAGDREAIARARAALKPPFSRLFLRFG